MQTQNVIDLIRSGDRTFFTSLYTSLNDSCRKYILKRGGDSNMVEEVFHEALYRFFVRVKEKEDFQLTTSVEGAVFGFIKMVWRQKCRTDARYQKVHTEIDEENWLLDHLVHSEPLVDLEDEDATVQVMQLMDDLGKDCKEVLLAFYVHRTSLQEIADELSFSYEYTKLKRFRCIKELRSKFLKQAS